MHAEAWRVLRCWGPPYCGISWHLLSDITVLWKLRALLQENCIYPYWGLGLMFLRSSSLDHLPPPAVASITQSTTTTQITESLEKVEACIASSHYILGVLFSLVTQKSSGIQGHFSSSMRSSAQVECCEAHTMRGLQLWFHIASKFISCCLLKGSLTDVSNLFPKGHMRLETAMNTAQSHKHI